MKISTKSRYAVMAMIELAMRNETRSLNLSELSKIQGISISYLEQLFTRLRQHGLVKGRRGPGGGYQLGLAPEDITISDIICAVSPADSLSHDEREPGGHHYVAAELWDALSDRLYHFLNGITLAQCANLPTTPRPQHGPGYQPSVSKHPH